MALGDKVQIVLEIEADLLEMSSVAAEAQR
jgi:hypothetical protein